MSKLHRGRVVIVKESSLQELRIPSNNRIAIQDGNTYTSVDLEWKMGGDNLDRHFYSLPELEYKISELDSTYRTNELLSKTIEILTESNKVLRDGLKNG